MSSPARSRQQETPAATFLKSVDRHIAGAEEFRRCTLALAAMFRAVAGRIAEFKERVEAVGDETLRRDELELEAHAGQIQGYINSQIPDTDRG